MNLVEKKLEFSRKLNKALALLQRAGISEGNYCPPMYKLYWKAGLRLPPPHFLGFLGHIFMVGLPVSLSVLGFYIMANSQDEFRLIDIFVLMLGVAVFVGLVMASYYELSRRKHRLPTWAALD